MRNTKRTPDAFTLVEILTTIAIIGILLAVLLPALNHVGKMALNVKQRAQFHTIEMAMEAFRSDIGDYPPSLYDASADFAGYTASHRLAEALIGRDGLGFHSESVYRRNGTSASGAAIYYPDIDVFTPEQKAANLSFRKGPYVELESANAVLYMDIFGNDTLINSYVLADSFRTVKHRTTGKKTGIPILYYRADRTKVGLNPDQAQWVNNTYNLGDSAVMLSIPHPTFGVHPLSIPANASIFYNRIRNPNFTSPARPYRAESFILQSAGHDGLFGTSDDVFNFDEEN
jgi:prepilin-type N-terminal cleavage/methylation domain-containing protein